MGKKKKKGYITTRKKKSSNFDVKKIILYTFALLLLIAIYLYLASAGKVADSAENQPREEPRFRFDGKLSFLDTDGSTLSTIDIEIADTIPTRTQGLMYRQSMEENQGMLFIFDTEHNIEMWMRNTYISLDMIFVREDRTIVSIETHTVPFSEEIIPSREPARYVIEVNAGFSDRHGIKPGHVVQWH